MKKALFVITIIFVCLIFLVNFANAEECQLSQRGDTQTQKCGPCKIQTRTCSCTCAQWISVFGYTVCVKWTTPCTWSAWGSCELKESHEVGTDPCPNTRKGSIDPDSKCVTEGIVLGRPYDGGTLWLERDYCKWESEFTGRKGWCYNDERDKKTYDYCWDEYTVAEAYLRGCSGCTDYSKWMCMSCGTRDCDYLDTACRDYHDVNRKCSDGKCYNPPCDSYKNEPCGTPCPDGGICDGKGACVMPNQLPSASNLQQIVQYCNVFAETGKVNLSWTYQDPENTNQKAYSLEIQQFIGGAFQTKVLCENISTAGPPSGGIGTSAVLIKSTPTAQLCDLPIYVGDIEYGRLTRWRVNVEDGDGNCNGDGNWSGWTDWTTAFSIYSHAYPWIDFRWTPQRPTANEVVQFTDQSEVYGGTTKVSLFWTFQDGVPVTSTSSTPKIKFTSAGLKTVTLKVTDSDGFICQDPKKTVWVNFPLPKWREVIPK